MSSLCMIWYILQVGPSLSLKQYFSTQRAPVAAAECLAIILRYLATGNSLVIKFMMCLKIC